MTELLQADESAVLIFREGVRAVPIPIDEGVFERMAEFAPPWKRPGGKRFLCNRVGMQWLDIYAARAGSMQLYVQEKADEKLETMFNGVPVLIWEDERECQKSH